MRENASSCIRGSLMMLLASMLSATNNQSLSGPSGASPPGRSSSSLIIPTAALEPWLQLSAGLWWFVIVTGFVTLLLLARSLWVASLLRPNRHFYFMSAIICADVMMVLTICCSLLVGKYSQALMGGAMCKTTFFVSNAATMFVNWTWVCMWGQRFLDVVCPMRRFTENDSVVQIKKMLCLLCIIALFVESWALFVVTEHRVDHIHGIYCDLDEKFVSYGTIKWVTLGDSIISYLIPFVLTVLADLGVLWRRSTLLIPVTREQIVCKSDQPMVSSPVTAIDCAKIQSARGMKQVRRRQRVITRCVLMATVDLLLNLPNYLLNLSDNFFSLQSSSNFSTVYVYAEAVAYILYFLQFPLTALNVHFLAWDMGAIRSKTQSPGPRLSVLTLASAAGNDQGIRCRRYSRVQSDDHENGHAQEKSLLQVPVEHML